MKVKVLFFGPTHDLTAFGQEELEIPDGESLAGLCRRYLERFPRLREMSSSLVVAVNQEIAAPSRPLRDGDEVAFMPPVSGGAGDDPDPSMKGASRPDGCLPCVGPGLPTPPGQVAAAQAAPRDGPTTERSPLPTDRGDDFYTLTRDVIPSAQLARQLKAPQDGAVVVFEGIVRNHSSGRKTLYLEYEGYAPMAVRKMEEIGREAKQKFAIDRIGMIHRLGRVEIGETSVAIIVTAAHRRAAFEACQYAIDHLKQSVPIWKKEYFEDGAAWAESESGDLGFQT
jgi:molybdopterin synthase catalytic subunit